MIQISIQLDEETRRQMQQLAAWWGLPEIRHSTPVISRAVDLVMVIESARRCLPDSEFVGFLAELYRPI